MAAGSGRQGNFAPSTVRFGSTTSKLGHTVFRLLPTVGMSPLEKFSIKLCAIIVHV